MQAARAQVERMLAARVGFAEIEKYIEDDVELPSDSKSALWLLAWSETNRRERRHAVGELLSGLGHDLGYQRGRGPREP